MADGGNFSFTLAATSGRARAGTFTTPHGVIQTPVFMPVGTQSAVKNLTWDHIEGLGAQIVLANAYHMYLRAGHERVAAAGGLHGWSGWHKPILTDSGGFQVFSLSHLRKLTEDGVRFQDPIDGKTHFIGPEQSMAIQNALGADIIMAFDECPPWPVSHEAADASLDLTHRWLERCWQAHSRPNEQALFPIMQGSSFEDLREKAAAHIAQYPAHGFAIGGVSVGEDRATIQKTVAFSAPLLPDNKPRYLMGVGTPEDLLESVRAGVDMFDCVLPTRNGRHGSFFTPEGRKLIKGTRYTDDFGPLVEGCDCYTCQHHHRAYLRHLHRAGEATGSALLSLHNIRTLVRLMEEACQAILQNRYDDFYHQHMSALQGEPLADAALS